MSVSTQASGDRETFEQQLALLRPKLHRYCARMTGSVIDGEDVVQDAMVRAVAALGEAKNIANLESWLFRVAHNVAIDFLRRRAREDALRSNEDLEMIVDPFAPADDPSIVAATLPAFMQLPVTQRSSVILMDVLGYQIAEIGAIMSASVPAIKSALHRGRARLRELGELIENKPLAVSEPQRSLLAAYIERFNARDFQAIRDMLADEVQLDLANRARRSGRVEVGGYFENYESVNDWQLKPGFVELQPAILVCDPNSNDASPKYFVLIEWRDANVRRIRDFRYARYVMNDARIRFELPQPRVG